MADTGAPRRGVIGEEGPTGRSAAAESAGRGGAGRAIGSRGPGSLSSAEDGAGGRSATGRTASRGPMGRGGRRRDEDDALDERPDYLVESDEVWGDGRTVARPVLGDRPEIDSEDL